MMASLCKQRWLFCLYPTVPLRCGFNARPTEAIAPKSPSIEAFSIIHALTPQGVKNEDLAIKKHLLFLH
jgi:hypothetical protein